MIWLVGLYLIHTIGELCLSPIGLSMVVKLAPARFVSLLMGVWFMSTATANKFAGDLSALYPEEVKLKSSVLAEGNLGQSLQAYQLDTNLFKSSLKDTVRIKQAAFTYNKSGELVGINPAMQEAGISYYQIYLVKAVNKEMAQAVVSEDGRYLAVNRLEKSKDGNVTVEKQKVEIWDLKPVKPKFLGMQIKNLFDFFMIFVYMAGASAILLFSIRNILFKLMHGIK
jgi:POT family proton-dependent oligopeptide transporter